MTEPLRARDRFLYKTGFGRIREGFVMEVSPSGRMKVRFSPDGIGYWSNYDFDILEVLPPREENHHA